MSMKENISGLVLIKGKHSSILLYIFLKSTIFGISILLCITVLNFEIMLLLP